ncbi:MAG: GxxExxY protein [Bacteroidota bacterium]
MTENEIATLVFKSSLEVHKNLGPGLLESTYQECLYFELKQSGLFVEKEKSLPVVYKNVTLDLSYRIDLFIENKFIVELKSVEAINPIHMSKIITYLKLSKCRLGMLINFNVPLLKQGVKRVINSSKAPTKT